MIAAHGQTRAYLRLHPTRSDLGRNVWPELHYQVESIAQQPLCARLSVMFLEAQRIAGGDH